jgi:Putative Actinobacterial Holin-X, holin superfamily III
MKATRGEVMGFFTEQPDRGGGIANTIGKITDGFSKLVTQHIALARLELAEDAKAMGGEIGRMAAFVPFLIVGYALLCGAISVVLARWLSLAGGLALVGALNMVGGTLGIQAAVKRLKGRDVMHTTLQEFNRSAASLAQDAARVTTETTTHGQR